MLNKIGPKQPEKKLVAIKSLVGGTLVRYYSEYPTTPVMLFVVSSKKDELIGAVSIENGNYLSPYTEVEVVPAGEVITITAGGK